MKFPYPQNFEDWQTAYTRDQAHAESGNHSARSNLISGIAILVVAGFLAVLAAPLVNFGALDTKLKIIFGIVMFVVAVLLYLVVSSRAIRVGLEFMAEFYRPKEEIKLDKLVSYRFNGVKKLPFPLNVFFQFEYIIAKDGEIQKSNEWPAWMSRHIGGPLLLIVFDGCALYLERGNRFSRVVGPGEKPPFLEWYETIKYVVDLRPKTKDGEMDVWTKDGINVHIKAQIECRIGDPQKRDPDSNLIYPYDPLAVKSAIERRAVRWPDRSKDEPSEFTWVDAAWGQVTGIIPGYIGGRVLNDLFIADRHGGQILSPDSVQEIFAKLNQATQVFGVYVTDFQVLDVVLPPEVETALKETWKVEKQSLITIKNGKLKAFDIRAQEEARAKAQRDLIINIADGLMKNGDKNYVEPLLLSFSRILDESLQDPLMRAYLANQTLETLEKMKGMLNDSKS